MMTRSALLLLAFLFAAPVYAQDKTADTTSAWRYFPLHVGDEWEYVFRGEDLDGNPVDPILTRRVTLRDSLIDGHRYFLQRTERYRIESGALIDQRSRLVRFDTTAARPVERRNGTEVPLGSGCPFDAAFGAELDCDGDGELDVVVSGSMEGYVRIGGDVLEGVPEKAFAPLLADFAVTEYVADVGPAHTSNLFVPPDSLVYARVDGIEYGARYPVGSEAGPEAGSRTTAVVFPNPTRSTAVVSLTRHRTGRVQVEVFDMLGRRVALLHNGVLRAGESRFVFDGTGLPAGSYFVRVIGERDEAVAPFVIAR